MAFFDIFRKKQQETPVSEEQARQQRQELDAGLEKTKQGLFSKLARAVAGRTTVDAEVLDELEEVLITSDVGASMPKCSTNSKRFSSRRTSAWRPP